MISVHKREERKMSRVVEMVDTKKARRGRTKKDAMVEMKKDSREPRRRYEVNGFVCWRIEKWRLRSKWKNVLSLKR